MESRAKLLGHPIHQMLIVFPLGLLATAVLFDVLRQHSSQVQNNELRSHVSQIQSSVEQHLNRAKEIRDKLGS